MKDHQAQHLQVYRVFAGQMYCGTLHVEHNSRGLPVHEFFDTQTRSHHAYFMLHPTVAKYKRLQLQRCIDRRSELAWH